MIVTTEDVDLDVGTRRMRILVVAPRDGGPYPGVLAYSDIFQLTGPMRRAVARLSGYGFVVAAPEIYYGTEPPGTVIPFDDAGRTRGLENAGRTPVADFDGGCRATLDYLSAHARVAKGQLGAMGFCIGGHLAFRAALQPDVSATVCFYGTGVHNGRLGKEADAGSLARAQEIRGALLMVFGTEDPHVPESARMTIERGLLAADVYYRIVLYPADHAFMRDEGPRYDPVATDAAFAEMVTHFRQTWAN
jgi:carboxymethylenebutenolidase